MTSKCEKKGGIQQDDIKHKESSWKGRIVNKTELESERERERRKKRRKKKERKEKGWRHFWF